MPPPSEPSVEHPLFARFYERLADKAESPELAARRERLLAGLSGRVLELGPGTGVNFPYYPPTVSEVVAVEPEPRLRGRAEEAAASASVPIRVVAAVAERLPFPDDSFDAAVAALV